MAEELKSPEEREQTMEEILDVLESAFENGVKTELTVLETNGMLRTNTVFVEALENGILYVSASKSSEIMSLEIGNVKKAC